MEGERLTCNCRHDIGSRPNASPSTEKKKDYEKKKLKRKTNKKGYLNSLLALLKLKAKEDIAL